MDNCICVDIKVIYSMTMKISIRLSYTPDPMSGVTSAYRQHQKVANGLTPNVFGVKSAYRQHQKVANGLTPNVFGVKSACRQHQKMANGLTPNVFGVPVTGIIS